MDKYEYVMARDNRETIKQLKSQLYWCSVINFCSGALFMALVSMFYVGVTA